MTPRFPRVVSLQMKTDGEAPSARLENSEKLRPLSTLTPQLSPLNSKLSWKTKNRSGARCSKFSLLCSPLLLLPLVFSLAFRGLRDL